MQEEKVKFPEIELIEMSILDDGKQMGVRFPKHIVEALQINPKRDIFIFQFDKEKLELMGSLEDKEVWKKKYGKKN